MNLFHECRPFNIFYKVLTESFVTASSFVFQYHRNIKIFDKDLSYTWVLPLRETIGPIHFLLSEALSVLEEIKIENDKKTIGHILNETYYTLSPLLCLFYPISTILIDSNHKIIDVNKRKLYYQFVKKYKSCQSYKDNLIKKEQNQKIALELFPFKELMQKYYPNFNKDHYTDEIYTNHLKRMNEDYPIELKCYYLLEDFGKSILAFFGFLFIANPSLFKINDSRDFLSNSFNVEINKSRNRFSPIVSNQMSVMKSYSEQMYADFIQYYPIEFQKFMEGYYKKYELNSF